MNEYIYIRVQVGAANPNEVALLAALSEQVTGQPVPDVVPHTSPGAIKFEHVRLVAESKDAAYAQGFDLLPPKAKGVVMNDYVIAV